MVQAPLDVIHNFYQHERWHDVMARMLDTVRKRLWPLVNFIDKNEGNIVYADFED